MTQIVVAIIGALGVIAAAAVGLIARARGGSKPEPEPEVPTDAEYHRRFAAAQVATEQITPEGKILARSDGCRPEIVVISDSITAANTDVLVSSDDNYFQAKGGVARALVEAGGRAVADDLDAYRGRRGAFRQGAIAITGGGALDAVAILHAAVIDLKLNHYPTRQVVAEVTRKSLLIAETIGVATIALPVFAGGTGSKQLTPRQSLRAMLDEIVAYCSDDSRSGTLTQVALYVYDPALAEPEELEALLRPCGSDRA